MLSSLLALFKALRQTLAERLGSRPAAAPAQPSRPPCDQPLCGIVEMSYRRPGDTGLQNQSVWIRVDTRKLVETLLAQPDIDLDALQGVERRGQGLRTPAPAAPASEPAPPDWHQKLQRVIQAPPSAARTNRRRIPPPPNSHRH